ncbi:MAG: hypothetical protein NTW10_07165 [Bacteroidetes bacterium]|nr:hypothetical protein [Bacteroidota bacterium]
MKFPCLISLLVIATLASCTHETRVMESVYPDGSPKRECVYTGNGPSRQLVRETTWYPKKKIQMTGEYKNSLRDGRWVYYRENGNIWSEGYFTKGKSEGKRLIYHENGKIYIEGTYKDGRPVGDWKFYDEKGNLVKPKDSAKDPEHMLRPVLKRPN